jgi:hypothetical protein
MHDTRLLIRHRVAYLTDDKLTFRSNCFHDYEICHYLYVRKTNMFGKTAEKGKTRLIRLRSWQKWKLFKTLCILQKESQCDEPNSP